MVISEVNGYLGAEGQLCKIIESSYLLILVEKYIVDTGELTQQLWACTASAEEQGLVFNNHIRHRMPTISVAENPMISGLPRHMRVYGTHKTQTSSHMHTQIFKKSTVFSLPNDRVLYTSSRSTVIEVFLWWMTVNSITCVIIS